MKKRLLSVVSLLLVAVTALGVTPRSVLLLLSSQQFNPAKIAGLVADWGAYDPLQRTLNGGQISELKDRTWSSGRNENLLVQSEDFSTTWARNRIKAFGSGSIVNATNAPDGNVTADFIQEDTTAANTHKLDQTTTYSPLTQYEYSVWVKPGGRTWVLLMMIEGSTGTQFGQCFFDVQNGATGTLTQAGGASGFTASIGNGGVAINGFFKCVLRGIPANSGTGLNVSVRIASGNGGSTYDGNGTDGLYVWGAQLRRPTSSANYVATTTVAEDALRSLLQGTAANQPVLSRTDNRGNLVRQSEDFSSVWTRNRINAFGATDTGALGAGSFANTARTTDPFGGSTADFIQEDATAGNSHFISQTINHVSGTVYKYSVYAKAAGRNWILLSDNSGSHFAFFDLQNGVVGTQTGAIGTIASAGNSWYLCTLNWTSGASASAAIWLSSDGAATSYNGDNTSGVYLWGAWMRPLTWEDSYATTGGTPAFPGQNGLATAYFDGAAYYLKTGGMASLVQPTTVVMVAKQWTWTSTDAVFDGNSVGTGKLYQHTASPKLALNAGSDSSDDVNLAIGSWGIVSAILNNASSLIQVGNATATTGTIGTSNLQGFTLGAVPTPTAYGNIQVARILVYNRVLSASELDYLKAGLAKQWGLTL